MKKNTLRLFFGLAAASLLASCGNPSSGGDNTESTSADTSVDTSVESSASSESDPEFDPSQQVEITFWHTMGKNDIPALEAIIAEFNRIYPKITVKQSNQGGYDEIHNLINNNIAAGTLPTMAYCYEDHVASYLSHNAVLDLTPYVNDATYGLGKNPTNYDLGDLGESDMTAGYWRAGNNYAVEGRYSLPFSKSTEAMFYNKTVFDAKGWTVPETWDDMWTLCERIKADPEYADANHFPLGYDSDANWMITSFEQYGLPYTSDKKEFDGSNFGFNTQANRDFVSGLKEKYDKGYFKTQGTSANSSYTSTLFTAGTLLMTVGSTGGTKHNYTGNFEVGVAGVPQGDKNEKKFISQGPSICFFKRGVTKAQRMAGWLFYKFLTNTEMSAYFAQHTGYNPVRDSSYSSHWLTDDMEDAVAEKGLIRDAFAFVGDPENGYSEGQFTSPAFKGSDVAREQMGSILSSVLLGTKSVEDAFNEAMQECLFAA